MVIVEASVFTRQVLELLTADEHRKVQAALVNRPNLGSLIEGSGGLRKLRWGVHGRGKRGGVRIIYYWAAGQERLLMLFVYAKTVRDDLTSTQLKILRKIVEEKYP